MKDRFLAIVLELTNSNEQLTGFIPLQNYQVLIYSFAGLTEVEVLVMIGVWGTWVVITVLCLSPWMDRIGRRKSLFTAYGFIIAGSLITVIAWARFEARGSSVIPLGAGIIVGMFVLAFGYGGVMNTFAPVVSRELYDLASATMLMMTVRFGDHAHLHACCWC